MTFRTGFPYGSFLFAFFCVINNLNIKLTQDFTVCLTAPTAVHSHHCILTPESVSFSNLLCLFCWLQRLRRLMCIWSLNLGQLSLEHTPPEVWPWKYIEKLSFFLPMFMEILCLCCKPQPAQNNWCIVAFWQERFYLGWAQFGPRGWRLSVG